MKILLSVLFAMTSTLGVAGTCDLQSFNNEIERIHTQFDNFEISGEDQHVAITLIERIKGPEALRCIVRGDLDGLTQRDLMLAKEALSDEVRQELTSLNDMLNYYEKQGNFLMVEQVREEISKVLQREEALTITINQLL